MTELTLWSSCGGIVELTSKDQAMEIANRWKGEHKEQTITLSWIENNKQVDEVLWDGVDHERESFFLEMNRLGR